MPLFSITFCGSRSGTQALLDGAFLNFSTKLEISGVTAVVSGRNFSVSITAKDSISGTTDVKFNSPLKFTVVGAGNLAVISTGNFSRGVATYTLKYTNTNLSGTTVEVIAINTESLSDSAIRGSSASLIAGAGSFRFTAPTSATNGAAFSVTLEALAPDGKVLTDFSGPVSLSIAQGLGTISPSAITGFNGGSATVNITYTGTPGPVIITATDSANSQFKSNANAISFAFGTGENTLLSLIAYPVAADKVRLSWNANPDAAQYNVYRHDGSNFVSIGTVSASANDSTYFTDTGRTTGTSYTYKVESQTAGAVILASSTAAATPVGCATTIGASTINSLTNWTKAASPYCITGNITVTGALLQIQAGTIVLVDSNIGITIAAGGLLDIAGSNAEPVIFTASQASPVRAIFPATVTNYWNNISFAAGSIGTTFSVDGLYNYVSGSRIQYAVIEYSRGGISSPAAASVGLLVEYLLARSNQTIIGYDGVGLNIRAGANAAVLRSSHFNNNRGFGNYAAGYGTKGGGAFLEASGGAGHVRATYNLFWANELPGLNCFGGGMYVNLTGGVTNVDVNNNYFYKNKSHDHGGGMYINNNSAVNLKVQNNYFVSNQAVTASPGGGLALEYGTNALVEKNTFQSNTALGAGGGALWCRSLSTMTLQKNRFVNNAALNGGAIFFTANVSSSTIQYNTFTGQNATAAGGILYLDNSAHNSNQFKYNQIEANSATGSASIAYIDTGTTSTTFDHNNIFNTAAFSPTAFLGRAGGALTYSFKNNWYGRAITAGLLCSASSDICSLSGGTDFNLESGTATTGTWPQCSVSPADANCVGAP